ncbi:MAG: class I SAM-dependent methyltransferase [Planctomycetes bacterium]|nr:class I SAM-dependent methyltransferase [Planctomycetota bacterium]
MSGNPTDAAREYYERTYQEHGEDLQTLMWSSPATQEERFASLLGAADLSGCSVLDVGCGFADLKPFLEKHFKGVCYTGLELMPDIAAVARKRQPGAEILEGTLDEIPSGRSWDWVVESGVFNMHWATFDVIESSLRKMFALAKRGVAGNFLSCHSTRPPNVEAAYYDPSDFVALAAKLTRRFSLVHDYRDNDFALYLFKDANGSGLEERPSMPSGDLIKRPRGV